MARSIEYSFKIKQQVKQEFLGRIGKPKNKFFANENNRAGVKTEFRR